MPSKLSRLALGVVLWAGLFDASMALAQPKAAPAPAAPTQALIDACNSPFGLKPAEKVKVCSQAIESGTLKSVGLAMAFYYRANALAQDGDQQGALVDYKQALRVFTDVIRVSAPSGPILFQRGAIYQMIGDADQAIVDYSDAIRLSPTDTYAYVNRGIVLYTKKDNNEGAISDFNAAIKINRREVAAWKNRGLVYKRKGDLDQAISDFTEALNILGNGAGMSPITGQPAPAGANASYFKAVADTTEAADTYYQRGLVYLDKGGKNRQQAIPLFDKAIADFNQAIKLNPTAAAHYVGRASAFMYKEEFKPAIADFTEAIRLSPGDEYTFLHRGIAYHSVNEPDNAISDYSEAHRINPLDVAPLINRGIVYYSKKGLYDKAIADFTEALEIDPKEVNALINRGISYREKNDPDKAIIDFSEALRLGMLTGDVLQFGSKDPEAVRHWAQVAHARFQRGTAYVTKKEYDLALADFNESIRLNPLEARAFVSRGGIYLFRNDIQKAIADFTEGIRLDPNYAFAYFQRGFAYHSLDEADKAIADYTTSIELDPKYITSYLNRGIVYYTRKGNFDAAIADFTKALQLGPDNINGLMHRGVAFGANGEFDKGFADLNRAIEVAPDFGLAYYYRAVLYALRGNADRALADYSEAVRLDPQNPQALVGRAGLYARMNDNDRAIADLDAAIKLQPKDPAAFYNRGYSYFAKGDYNRAIADYSEAIKLNPNMAAAYNNRCLTRGIVGGNEIQQALADCDQALKLAGGNIEVRDTRAFIALKTGDFANAIKDYNLALQIDPNHARALYGRGLAKVKSNDKEGGDKDIAAAVKLVPTVGQEFSKFGF
ncbi:MAG: tetratricopeptide repeat protein [Proteobacteria bacterium]|nr:tetratricopeptide repeat protein [Pseudomonadota bacterium]